MQRSAPEFKSIFAQTKTIAVVGMSDDPTRASHDVAMYLNQFYTVIPVNPMLSEIAGLRCYPDLDSVPGEIDMVDLFQRSEKVGLFVGAAIRRQVKCFWMQMGISNVEAREALEPCGITVVENRCTKTEHARLRMFGAG